MAKKAKMPWTPENLSDVEIKTRAFIREHLFPGEVELFDVLLNRWLRGPTNMEIRNVAPDDCPESERPTARMMSVYAACLSDHTTFRLLNLLARERAKNAGHEPPKEPEGWDGEVR